LLRATAAFAALCDAATAAPGWARPAVVCRDRDWGHRRARHEEKAPRAPARARLSLLPSGPGEVHEMNAARGVDSSLARHAIPLAGGGVGNSKKACILGAGGFA